METIYFTNKPLLEGGRSEEAIPESSTWDPRHEWAAKTVASLVSSPSGNQVENSFKYSFEVGMGNEYGFPKNDHWLVFEGREDEKTRRRLHIHETALEGFLQVVRMDIAERAPIMYSIGEIKEMADRIKSKQGDPVHNISPTPRSSWWKENWFIVLGLFALVGFGVHQGNRVDDNLTGSEVRLNGRIDSVRVEMSAKLDKQSSDLSEIKASLSRIEGVLSVAQPPTSKNTH